MPEPYGIETAGSFGVGNSYVIVSVGTTDFTLIGAVDNRPGVVFEATGAGTGDGTARRLNSQLGRIGGKLLADNLLRDGIDLAVKNTAYDTPVLYLKINPEVSDTVSAGSFQLGIRYKIRTLGTTNYLLIGSFSNTVGTIFTATGPGTGTGTADRISDVIADTDGVDAFDPSPNQGSGSAIGFNTDSPAYDLDINNEAKTTNAEATSQANISNIIINSAGYITTSVGTLYISPSGHDPVINFDRMITDDLYFSDNTIGSFSNANIEINPSGSGTIELTASTNITGNLTVTGSVTMNGTLTAPNSIQFGDSSVNPPPNTRDTLDFNTFITQDLNPGIDNEFNLGSPTNKWGDVWAPDWTEITNLLPSRIRVSDQQILDGIAMEIRSLQSNDDLVLNPATGILYVEELKFSDDEWNLGYTLDNPNAFGTSGFDVFGASVAISGDRCIVGAYLEGDAGGTDSGKAYIFDVTTGALIHTLDNPNAYSTSLSDRFGRSVSISGNYAIVGAYFEDDAGGASSGKAYIFNVTTGSLVYTLDNPNAYFTGTNDNFGYSVSISGERCIVGAYREDDAGGSSSGKAYIFNVTTGALVHTLDNPNAYSTSASDQFGFSVAISGDYAIVGAYQEDDAGGTDSGKAYIFDVTTGALVHTLDNPNAYGTSASDQFGISVAISGDRCIVSAYAEDDAGGTDSGKAYIFDVTTGALIHTLDNPNAYGTSASDQFGWSVAISGDRCIVGAWFEDDAGGTDSGKAYIFNVTTGALVHTLDNPNAYGTSASDQFGISVAISEDRCIVGANAEDDAGGSGSGKAYVFENTLNQSIIKNLNPTTPVQFASTGAGYLRFMGTNAVLIPAGDNASRPGSPEVGDTRWNTDEQYLECFDGSVYVIATGGGEEVTQELMEELGNVYSLILG